MGATPGSRLKSLDALRGLNLYLMLFVNDLAAGRGSSFPQWARHFNGTGDGITFVDLIFPGFIFIVGMSVPLSVKARVRAGDPPHLLFWHIATRTVSLLFMGIVWS